MIKNILILFIVAGIFIAISLDKNGIINLSSHPMVAGVTEYIKGAKSDIEYTIDYFMHLDEHVKDLISTIKNGR